MAYSQVGSPYGGGTPLGGAHGGGLGTPLTGGHFGGGVNASPYGGGLDGPPRVPPRSNPTPPYSSPPPARRTEAPARTAVPRALPRGRGHLRLLHRRRRRTRPHPGRQRARILRRRRPRRHPRRAPLRGGKEDLRRWRGDRPAPVAVIDPPAWAHPPPPTTPRRATWEPPGPIDARAANAPRHPETTSTSPPIASRRRPRRRRRDGSRCLDSRRIASPTSSENSNATAISSATRATATPIGATCSSRTWRVLGARCDATDGARAAAWWG